MKLLSAFYSLSAAAMLGIAATGSSAPIIIDNYEFATDDTAAQAGVTVVNSATVTATVGSGSGADKTEGSFSLRTDLTVGGTPFEQTSILHTLSSPIVLSKPYNSSGSDPVSDLGIQIDIKGSAVYAAHLNLFVNIIDSDGDKYRFINFHDAALGSGTFNANHGVNYFGQNVSVNNVLNDIAAVEIVFQNPDNGFTGTGNLYIDNLRVVEPSGPITTGLNYTIPLITSGQAPNVTDTTFDSIYASGGHPVITGNDWKQYGASPPSTPIGGSVATDSKAYLLTDGTNLYFGMIVYDPNTADATNFKADTGDDTYTKWNVVDIEVAFSHQQGTNGPSNAVKFAMDAFSHIDDVIPDSAAGVAADTTAKTQNNSYVIDANHWAMEFKVAISDIVGNVGAGLADPLPVPPAPWYGHIGYQANDVSRPLYAAGHANGFSNFTITYDTTNMAPPASVSNWSLY